MFVCVREVAYRINTTEKSLSGDAHTKKRVNRDNMFITGDMPPYHQVCLIKVESVTKNNPEARMAWLLAPWLPNTMEVAAFSLPGALLQGGVLS